MNESYRFSSAGLCVKKKKLEKAGKVTGSIIKFWEERKSSFPFHERIPFRRDGGRATTATSQKSKTV